MRILNYHTAALALFTFFLQFVGWTQDSSQTLDYDQYISIVKEHHPIAYQALLKGELGEAYVRKSKGGFDPKLEGDVAQKYFEDKQYYSYINAGLKVPTWFGVSLNAGYSNNAGERLNPEAYTGDNGLWQAGVTINLGKGLFIDERRGELKAAKIYLNSTFMEQRLILNQLIFDARLAYWDWFKAQNKVAVYKNAVTNAEIRFEGIKQNALFGDKPYVDTLKALIQLQNISLNLIQAELDLKNKRGKLGVFLWQDGFLPLELDSLTKAPDYTSVALPKVILNTQIEFDTLIKNHPEMLQSQYKIDISRIDYRLKKEALKPTLQLKYNALSSATAQGNIQGYNVNDYNWGAKFSYPIFTQKERANVDISSIQILEQETKLENKNAQIAYKIQAAYNTWLSTNQQMLIITETAKNYEALFNAELTLFEIGESSLFLVNARDNDQIKAKLNWIESQVEYAFAKAIYDYQTVSY